MEELTIQGIEVAVFIIGTIQVIKNFLESEGNTLSVKATTLISLFVALLFIVPTVLAVEGFLAPEATAIVVVILKMVGYALGIVGGYGVVNNKALQPMSKWLMSR